MEILETLQMINAGHGPSGDEAKVADALETLARPYADEITRDAMGNLIVHKRGNGPKVMFAAHMDSIGFIVTHIDDNGYLRVGRLGGLRAFSCLHTPVRFKSGVRGLVAADQGVKEKELSIDDLYIDIGAKDKAEAEKMVKLGDTAVFAGEAFVSGDRIVSPYLDDRISCVALLMALSQVKDSPNDLYFVFTVQEELGLRGGKTAAWGVDPDYGIAVDVTGSDDELNSKHSCNSVAGGGAAVKVMDSSVICHPQMVDKLCALAEEKGISYQRDILRAGGTDAGAIHTTRAGVYTGGVSIPCRYIHSPVELCDLRDVEAAAALLQAFAEAKLDKV